ncbi:tRNA glutamyl-Q(34) synthetase GluQRS [Massilia antarctica]|uniref:tRNA glutamyl-Q(34) synthetase GluQRS n=1 Tax=Massilia antarctica TaxID=2765360 RepID=UPI0006BB7B8C|nr:tRNA glutamyl-Q(34) synthetase GluQRS [Massilia sp. H27-R4]MCY0913726.1 tRNA glutamyl-Q(34) synthetase GluQRS [Massilia sp. H27-R4]CUI04596.1 glutamyl-Q-tRNA synthetase [Janthinobacterium sp. CG23_2]CUU28382.1 glutamyl-Q-tRNA synthetase [Janthinobacterium sp. CG23_2]
MQIPTRYIGRFAPSPSGPLHQGSLVAAMASYLDAKAHCGRWLVRIEDVDQGRSVPGAAEAMLALLRTLRMDWDGDVVWQSQRKQRYQGAADQLGAHVYPCGCNRREIADSRLGTAPDGSAIYPGTCRHGLAPGKTMRSLRVRVPDAGVSAGNPATPASSSATTASSPGATADDAGLIVFTDRAAGRVAQHLATESGDFVLKRADGFWAYQLAVVVDDAEQGVTDIVRGADLIDSTPRQIYLQQLLGVPTPRYLHVPVVRNADGEKLSKQTGALALAPDSEAQALSALQAAAAFLQLQLAPAGSVSAFWQAAIPAWANRFT